VKLTTQPEMRQRILASVKELDSAIQQIKSAVFDLQNTRGPST
jgi:hypothetical protein